MDIHYEALESRRLLSGISFSSSTGTWTIEGTEGNENYYVSIGAGNIVHIIDNGTSIAQQPQSALKKIVFNGNGGNDSFYINGGIGAINAYLTGGAGDDQLYSGGGNDTLIGSDGRDQLTGNDGNDSLDGGEGDDNLGGGKGNDTILGGAGVGRDLMVGGEGNDLLDGGFGADTFRGGIGSDTASYASRLTDVFVDISPLNTETADDGEVGEKDFLESDMENLIGGAGNDLLIGTITPTTPVTTPGFSLNNILRGNGGNDTLIGNAGNDVLDGGLGTDELTGGAGTDTADYGSRSENLSLNLDGIANDGAAGELDRIDGDIENLVGGRGNDKLVGNDQANALRGNAGNDTLVGALGGDFFMGNDGVDVADYSARTEKLTLSLDGKANDGAAGENDRIDNDVENLIGGGANDILIGNASNNWLKGNGGHDTIYGGAGNDTLYGDSGQDRLYGEAGNDTLMARNNPGAKDILDGGAGKDRAQYDALDVRSGLETAMV